MKDSKSESHAFVLVSACPDDRDTVGVFGSLELAKQGAEKERLRMNEDLGWTLSPPRRWQDVGGGEWMGEMDESNWFIISEEPFTLTA